jgi:hypothetical protein
MNPVKYIWNSMPIWISLWGGITGTIALIITWMTYRKDRPELDIRAKVDLRRDKPEEALAWCLEVILRNKGRRPCYVDRIALELPTPKSFKYGDIEMTCAGPLVVNLCQNDLLIKLEESQKVSIPIKRFSEGLLMAASSQGEGVGTLLVVDSLGREIRHSFNLPSKDDLRLTKRRDIATSE